MTKIYTAGKIWHAPKFQFLRDQMGFDVNARWIDFKDDDYVVQHDKRRLWEICYEDVRDCDVVLIYAEMFDEEQRGALVEVGMAYGMRKPIVALGRCMSTCANGISDVAFTHYDLWNWVDESLTLDQAATIAVKTHKQTQLLHT